MVLNAPGTAALPGSVSLPETFGTPVLWTLLSVNIGPPWQETHAALPRNSSSPRLAASDIVPLSKSVTGGVSVFR